MINGTHVLLYTADPDADRAFFRDVLGLRSVDAGGGWLIFALPPAELALHPAGGESPQPQSGQTMLGAHVYLMCDDVRATVNELAAKNVRCSELHVERWGIRTTIALPGGGAVGLYQPTHPTAI
jgi:catechol 2,3-dioxygenase-like lactoylglutathione lyase family enzyme